MRRLQKWRGLTFSDGDLSGMKESRGNVRGMVNLYIYKDTGKEIFYTGIAIADFLSYTRIDTSRRSGITWRSPWIKIEYFFSPGNIMLLG